ncbi:MULTISPECIES: CoA transferase [Brevibacillus]|uniref:CoA transferase n=1 Tax=Brevibacillus invocatus TaxID=173959 RepID=A0A3M8C8E8_9BACL|nr:MULTISPECIES: CoA transferase [Brevibacillus]MDH4617763.1 CoA transferase [Brevibacillus sp. AY1]RNB71992.1 hypothetical protein EDM52_14650 [Brevibacillus invocatus]
MSGFTSVNGSADGPPTLPGMALADGVSGAFGALSLMIALHERANNPERKGQCIDISLYEPLMRLLEPHIVAYDQLGIIANRVGNGSLSVAPRNAYQTKEGKWVAISGADRCPNNYLHKYWFVKAELARMEQKTIKRNDSMNRRSRLHVAMD